MKSKTLALYLVILLSIADLALTVQYLPNVYEANPIARWMMDVFGYCALPLVMLKIITVSVSVTILASIEKRCATIASWVCVAILLGTVIAWNLYPV